jgi:hypothetical protein
MVQIPVGHKYLPNFAGTEKLLRSNKAFPSSTRGDVFSCKQSAVDG